MASKILAISEVNRKTLITSSYYPIGSSPTGVSYVDGSYTGDISKYIVDGDSKYFYNIPTSSINGSGDGLTVNFLLSNSGGTLIVGSPSVVGDGDGRGTNYFVDETVLIDGSSLTDIGGESGTDDITFIVTSTDFSDGDVIVEGNPDVYIYYDRYDHVLYHVSKVGGIEVIYTVSGDIYTPTTLPGKAVMSAIKLENNENILVTFSENLSQLVQDFPNEYISVTNISVDNDRDERGLIRFLSGSLVGSKSIRLKFNPLPFDVLIGFDVTVLDGLENLTSAVVSNLLIPNPNGVNYGPSSYIEWTGPAYFLDENYNVTYYDRSELIDSFGIAEGGNISRLGFPLHLSNGEGGIVTDEMIANGQFFLAATVVELPYVGPSGTINDVTEISPQSVRDILVDGDGNFNTELLDISRSAYSGVVELYPEGTENRYIFFPVEPITYNGGDVLVIYWMNGIDGPRLGWNGGYITGLNTDKVEEVLAINATNDYLGSPGVNQPDGTPEKAAIVFTIANSDITNQTRVFTHPDDGSNFDTISDYLQITRAGSTGPSMPYPVDFPEPYGGLFYNPLYEFEYSNNYAPIGKQFRQDGINRYISMKSRIISHELSLDYQPYIGPNYPGISIDDNYPSSFLSRFGVVDIIEYISDSESYYTDGVRNENPYPEIDSDAFSVYLNTESLLQSPAFTLWNADGWADLTNVTSRTYDSIENIMNPKNNSAARASDSTSQLGPDLVMYDVIDNAYYKISLRSFTEFGGFQYYITPITVPYETVPFTHTDNGSEVDEFNANLQITRGVQGAIYNPRYESEYEPNNNGWGTQFNGEGEVIYQNLIDGNYPNLPTISTESYPEPGNLGGIPFEISLEETFGTSPAFTLWNADGWEDLPNVSSRQFTTFRNCLYGSIGNYILDSFLVMYDILDDKYYRIQFTEWTSGGGGGFQYYKTLIQTSQTENTK